MRCATRHLVLAGLLVCAATWIRTLASADLFSVGDQLPDDVDLVLAIDGASSRRSERSGSVVTSLLHTAFPEVEARWRRFAQQLGWTSEAAFDQLLGRRVTIIADGIWSAPPGRRSWALLAEIDADVEAQLRRALKAAPRSIVAGRAVLSIEDGRFVLASVKRGDVATLLMAPADDTAFFTRLLPLLREPPKRALSDADWYRTLRQDDAKPTALLCLRRPAPDQGWIGAAAHVRQGVVRARFEITTSMMKRPVEPWSMTQWAALQKTSLLSIMEPMPQPGDVADDYPALLSLLPGWRQPELAGVWGRRYALAAREAPGGGLAIVAAIETCDIQRTAGACDKLMRDLLIKTSAMLGVGAWDYDFKGEHPEAMRVVKLSDADGPRFPFFGRDGFSLSWTMRPVIVKEKKTPHGWLIAGTDRAFVSEAAAALTSSGATGGVGPWASVGSARPAELIEAIEHTPEGALDILQMLKSVQYVGWRITMPKEHRLHGAAKLVLAPHKE